MKRSIVKKYDFRLMRKKWAMMHFWHLCKIGAKKTKKIRWQLKCWLQLIVLQFGSLKQSQYIFKLFFFLERTFFAWSSANLSAVLTNWKRPILIMFPSIFMFLTKNYLYLEKMAVFDFSCCISFRNSTKPRRITRDACIRALISLEILRRIVSGVWKLKLSESNK